MASRHLDPPSSSLSRQVAVEIGRRLRRPATAVAATVVAGSIAGFGVVPAVASHGDSRPSATAADSPQPDPVGLSVARATADAAATEADPQAQTHAPAPAPQPAPAPEPVPAPAPAAVLPVDDCPVTSGFGPRWGTLHAGVDFAGPLGTPEKAVADGTVVQAGAASGFGQAVYIQHDNGDVTVYGHMRTILVAVGEHVSAGQVIAEMGMEGQATGSHLHLEVHVGGITGTPIDPVPWLAERGVTV